MFLSIIIPVYNLENHLRLPLESLARQTCGDFEVILVDDGSTDGSLAKARELAGSLGLRDCRVLAKENGGVSSARNFGLRHIRGEYVFFLDGDDYVSERLVESLADALRDGKADLLFWMYDRVDASGRAVWKYRLPAEYTPGMSGQEMLVGTYARGSQYFGTISAAYRSGFLLCHGLSYQEGCVSGEDVEFSYKALLHAQSVRFIGQTLAYYVQRPGSAVHAFNVRRFDSFAAGARVSDYLEREGGRELAETVRRTREYILAQRYFEQYVPAVDHLVMQYGMGVRAAARRLDRELDARYPGLRDRAMLAFRRMERRATPRYLKMRGFGLSPLLYLYASRLSPEKLRHRDIRSARADA